MSNLRARLGLKDGGSLRERLGLKDGGKVTFTNNPDVQAMVVRMSGGGDPMAQYQPPTNPFAAKAAQQQRMREEIERRRLEQQQTAGALPDTSLPGPSPARPGPLSMQGLKDAFERRVAPVITEAKQTALTGGSLGELLQAYGEASGPLNQAMTTALGRPIQQEARQDAPPEMTVPTAFERRGDVFQQMAGQTIGDPLNLVSPQVSKAGELIARGAKALAPTMAEIIEEMAMKGVPVEGFNLKPAMAPPSKRRIEKPVEEGRSLTPSTPTPPVNINDYVVSTRLPTAVKRTEDPLTQNLVVDYDTFQRDPDAFTHNMGLVNNYTNFGFKGTSKNQADQAIEQIKDNLLFLHDAVPKQTRARSQLWYDGANRIANLLSNQYDISTPAASGVMAVLSPQKDWFMNVSLGHRVIDIMKNQNTQPWDKEMQATAKRLFGNKPHMSVINQLAGKTLAELTDPIDKALWVRIYDEAKNPRNYHVVTPEGASSGLRLNKDGRESSVAWGSTPEIAKAVKIFENPDKATISKELGEQHKVRNFYNNILDPNNPAGYATIDTHAVAAGLLRPLSGSSEEVLHNFGGNLKGSVGPKNSSVSGLQGTYALYNEAYRRAAEERGILPRQMQSITWEAVRGLFPDDLKRNTKKIQEMSDVWKGVQDRRLTPQEARSQIIDRAGGIDAPEWER